MAAVEWFSKWRDTGPFRLDTQNSFVSCITHLHSNNYAVAKFNDYGATIVIYSISKKGGDTDELDFMEILQLGGQQAAEITSMVFLQNNTLLTTSKDNFLRVYNLSTITETTPRNSRITPTGIPTVGTPIYKAIPYGTSIFYMAKQEDCRERACTMGHAILLVEVDQGVSRQVNTPVKIKPPSGKQAAIPTCFGFVEVGGKINLRVALDDGNLYRTSRLDNSTEILIPVLIHPTGTPAVITDMTVIEDGRLVVIYSSGHIYISTDDDKTMFQLLDNSRTDANDGNNQLLSLPGNSVAASFKRNVYPNPFPAREEIVRNPELINTVASGLYMKLGRNAAQEGMRIWYGHMQEIAGLTVLPPGILNGDVSWISMSKDGYYMPHTYSEPAPLPLPRKPAAPPPAPPLRTRPPPPPIPALLPKPKPKPRGVNAAVQHEDEYNSPEDKFEEPPVNTAETSTETEPLEEIPEEITSYENAGVGNGNIRRFNASSGPPDTISIDTIQIVHEDNTKAYEVKPEIEGQDTILRAKAAKDDRIAYVIPTIEERPGLKLQYRVDESNSGWIDTQSGVAIPFTLVEGENKMELQVVLIKRNRLNAGNDPSNRAMQPDVKNYTIYIERPEDVYLETLRVFVRGSLVPMKFNRDTLEYAIKVDKNIENVLVRPTAPSGKKFRLSYLIDDNEKPLKSDAVFKVPLEDGENRVSIHLTGALGKEVVYTLSIYRRATGWWVPADKGLPTYQKTRKNMNRAKNILREMRMANQTRRRINAGRATMEAARAAEIEAARIQRLKNARSGKLVTPPSSRPPTPRPATPVGPLPAASAVNEARLGALRAAQEERGRAAVAALAASRPATPAPRRTNVFRPSSSGRSWRGGLSRKANRRTRRKKSRRVRR